MTTEYRDHLGTLYRQHHISLQRGLHRAFPRADLGLVEDAVASAFEDALERPRSFVATWQRSGHAGLLLLFKQVAWRHLRGHFRKKSSQCEIASLHAAREPDHVVTPFVIAVGRETQARIEALIAQAALLFGGRRAHALALALHARLEGSSDTEAARRHRVPREYVNRAKRWICAQLRAPHRAGRPLLARQALGSSE